jgi:hypothetical protein
MLFDRQPQVLDGSDDPFSHDPVLLGSGRMGDPISNQIVHDLHDPLVSLPLGCSLGWEWRRGIAEVAGYGG